MLRYIYQVCLIIFLLQGVLSPSLLIISGFIWWKQSRKLEKLRKELGAGGKKSKSVSLSEIILESLPKLTPLKCDKCGGNVLLEETETLCPYCDARGDLPVDYVAANSLKTEVKKILRSAVRHWRVANVLTNPAVAWFFFLMIFIEPLVIFPTTLIGSNLYSDTWFDRAFASAGETWGFLVVLCAFFGFVVWMLVFIFLNNLSKSLRTKLPVVPVFDERVRGSETASCQTCGGGIEYDAGDFACICSYCNVENFRAQFVRRARARAERQKTETRSVLFGAMEIIEDFTGTFFVLLIFLVGCPILFGIFYALKSLL
jgi:Zn finger protein HypA/HybF involved in hydrogenase expression